MDKEQVRQATERLSDTFRYDYPEQWYSIFRALRRSGTSPEKMRGTPERKAAYAAWLKDNPPDETPSTG